MLTGSLAAILFVLLVLLVAYAAFWIIGQMGVPDPFNVILRVVVGVVALFVLATHFGVL